MLLSGVCHTMHAGSGGQRVIGVWILTVVTHQICHVLFKFGSNFCVYILYIFQFSVIMFIMFISKHLLTRPVGEGNRPQPLIII